MSELQNDAARLEALSFIPAIADVDITDDFMFSYVMRDPSICIDLLRLLLPDVEIREIRYLADDGSEIEAYPEPQKAMAEAFDRRGVRMDVYLDDGKSVYNVEMQTTKQKALPQRARLYQAHMDINQLGRGHEYDELRPSYMMMICKFDPFGLGLYRYEFENRCVDRLDFALNDGTHKLFFNTAGKQGEIGEHLRDLLAYMNNANEFPVKETDCGLIHRIDRAVGIAKMDEEWRRAYMTFEMKQRDMLLRGIEIGEERGIEIGEKRGIEIGEKRGIEIGEERGEKRGIEIGAWKAKAESAKQMLLSKLPIELIVQCSGLSVEEVKAIEKKLALS